MPCCAMRSVAETFLADDFAVYSAVRNRFKDLHTGNMLNTLSMLQTLSVWKTRTMHESKLEELLETGKEVALLGSFKTLQA